MGNFNRKFDVHGQADHLWVEVDERFDRDQEEMFSVQDQVVHTIVGTLVGRVNILGG
jgi:TolB-like protein